MDPSQSATLTGLRRSSHKIDLASVRIRGLNHWFGSGEGRSQALTDIDLDIDPGEVVILTGPSGSGKTTLLTIIGSLRRAETGSVRVLGRDLTKLDAHGVVDFRRSIGFIFQSHNLFNSLSALENVRMATTLRPGTPDEMHRRASEMLTRIGMGERLGHLPSQLSGGQSQRVAIARALVNSPPLVLADEPTASLDAKSGQEVLNLLHELADGPRRSTVLIVTHDQRVLDRADRIVNLVGGRIVSNVMPQVSIRIVKTLMKIPALANYPSSMLTQFADQMFVESFPAGTTIVREGWPGDRFYVIGMGTAEESVQGNPVRRLGEGDYFGYGGPGLDHKNPTTVRATSELEAFVMTRENLLKAMAQDKALEERVKIALMSRQ